MKGGHHLCVHVCVCVCVREKERVRDLVDEIIILRRILEKCDVAGLRKFAVFGIRSKRDCTVERVSDRRYSVVLKAN